MTRSPVSFLMLFWPLTFQSTAPVAVDDCPRRIDYVCGSDGVTYNNLCLLERQAEALGTDDAGASKKTNQGLVMAFKGLCWGEDDPGWCDTVCSTLYEPVCGTDRETYANGCWLGRANCGRRNKAFIKRYYKGEC